MRLWRSGVRNLPGKCNRNYFIFSDDFVTTCMMKTMMVLISRRVLKLRKHTQSNNKEAKTISKFCNMTKAKTSKRKCFKKVHKNEEVKKITLPKRVSRSRTKRMKNRKKMKRINNASPYTTISRYDKLDILNGRKPRGYEQRKKILFLSMPPIRIESDSE